VRRPAGRHRSHGRRRPVGFTVGSAEAEFPIAEQGLATTRVTCRFVGPADLSGAATVEFADGFLPDRIGWREITATGVGLRIDASDVPAASVSQELRAYPEDLLLDPLDQRTARITVESGSGSAAPLAALPATGVGWLDSALSGVTRLFSDVARSPT
jgi:nickel/cobalt exporter